jgi:hypothetical protein
MAGPLLNVAYDPASLGLIAKFSNFANYLNPEMSAAMEQIGELIVPAAQANTWTAFQHPTGKLSDAIGFQLVSPMEVVITVDVPYAWRLEMGYHAADSLGRLYDESAEPYAEPALLSSEDQIMMLMGNAAAEAFAVMGEV